MSDPNPMYSPASNEIVNAEIVGYDEPATYEAAAPATAPPGWHMDAAAGALRWWDGDQWTDHFHPPQAPAAPAAAIVPAYVAPVAQPQPQYAQPQQYQQPHFAQQIIVQQAPKKRVNHGLHLVLTILTFGLWAPVWIILAIANS